MCAALLVNVTLFPEAEANTTTETEVSQGQLIGILQVSFIQNELLLSDEQIAKIAAINQIPIAVSFSDAIAPLKTILTDDQLKEFKRNALPGLMLRAFTVSEVRDSLELTQEQVSAIAAIQANSKFSCNHSKKKLISLVRRRTRSKKCN